MSFLDGINREVCPEFNGYNTAIRQNQEHPLEPNTRVVYQPLIDMKPSDLNTMITVVVRAQQLTCNNWQIYLDQQLYRVALEVFWPYPVKFPNLVLRHAGMHILMICVGSVGTLMNETGLAEVLTPVFGRVADLEEISCKCSSLTSHD